MIKRGHLNAMSTLTLIIIFIFTLLFQGCSTANNIEINNTYTPPIIGEIVETQLTDREKKLISGFNIDNFFIFDANIKNKNIEDINFFVDCYEKGSFKGRNHSVATNVESLKTNNFKMIFSSNISPANNSDEIWTLSMTDNETSGKSSSIIKFPENIHGTSFVNIKHSEIIKGKELILAVITKSERTNLSSSTIDSLNDKDETIKEQANKELLKNEYVYIFKCIFD